MSAVAIDQQPRRQAEDDEKERLSALLTLKLRYIPAGHLPAIRLSDILNETSLARHLPKIPHDLQLAFFLRHRALINSTHGRPLKNAEAQHPDVTRAIWYYRLDATHQFQRYHDTTRWNLAIFAALLTNIELAKRRARPLAAARRHSPRSHLRDLYIPRAAERFMRLYLRAVMEHHNEPHEFYERERFLGLWKEGEWDMFTKFAAGQKKLLKNELKALVKEWEDELDFAMEQMGRHKYDVRVAKFVGSVVPGRKDQGLPPRQPGSSSVGCSDGAAETEGPSREENDMLESLRVPLNIEGRDTVEEVQKVTDLRYALDLVSKIRPSDMLPVLLQLFPVDGY